MPLLRGLVIGAAIVVLRSRRQLRRTTRTRGMVGVRNRRGAGMPGGRPYGGWSRSGEWCCSPIEGSVIERPPPAHERYELRAERARERIAQDDGLDGPDLIALPPATWEVVGHRVAELRAVAETGGLEAATAWLDARGLAWTWARGAPRPRC